MTIQQQITAILHQDFHVRTRSATPEQLYHAIGKAVLARVAPQWEHPGKGRRAAYLSAEFLLGRLIDSNLLNTGERVEVAAFLEKLGIDLAIFEKFDDPALGNGGLGRLAACFLDSAATKGIPLDGYGIRYRYGLFRQRFEDGFQREEPDDWQRFGDPWSIRREEDRVLVTFGDQRVYAVPYDTPVIGYGGQTVNNLRLWQAEPLHPFLLEAFQQQDYAEAFHERDRAEAISAVLYPSDETEDGKRLRLKQQYFFVSASLQDMLRRYKSIRSGSLVRFAERFAIQLNDTHPVVAIPELIRLLVEQEGLSFTKALNVARAAFSYTNHTVMPEALETWHVPLFREVLPHVYEYVVRLHHALQRDLRRHSLTGDMAERYWIITDNTIHMARMAFFVCHTVNGVARLHTELLQTRVFPEWQAFYPGRIQNKTNGITQRRWLALANPGLAALITDTIGDGWLTELGELRRLEAFQSDPAFLQAFAAVKETNKQRLAALVEQREGISLRTDFLFDVQVKRLHEYKRQLLNAFSIFDLYLGLKEGRFPDFTPTVYLLGGKAAPGYFRAKAVIKYIQELARRINSDPEVHDRMRVVFLTNYDVSYAEVVMPAADISEQISTAGTEASGTGNMKLMLNGAVTLGTFDGANIEIVEQAGEENNYIFGLTVEEIEELRPTYAPLRLYNSEPRIRRVVDSLIDGTFDDGGTGMFLELYHSLLKGASWHRPDAYFLLADFLDYQDTRLRAGRDYRDRTAFTRKCLLNTANAGIFSSDRTIMEYAKDIWKL